MQVVALSSKIFIYFRKIDHRFSGTCKLLSFMITTDLEHRMAIYFEMLEDLQFLEF